MDKGFREQIRRAITSVSFNIAEGFERSGRKEFIQFLGYAKGSIGEVRAHLYTALDLGYINEIEFKRLRNKAFEISKTLSGLITYLTNCDFEKKYIKREDITIKKEL
jgi:four helix bundle protein